MQPDEILERFKNARRLETQLDRASGDIGEDDKKVLKKEIRRLKDPSLYNLTKFKQKKQKLLPERKNLIQKWEDLKKKTDDKKIKDKINSFNLSDYKFETSNFDNLEKKIPYIQDTKKLLEEYKTLIQKQQQKNNELKNNIEQVERSKTVVENKQIKIVQYSLYFGFLCLSLMIILNAFILKSKNRRKKLTGSTNILDKVLFSLSFVSFISYLIHLNIRKHLVDLNIITITYTLIMILMILIHQKKIVDVEEFTKKDKKNFMILISIKLGLLFFLFVYLFLTSRIYKDTQSLQKLIKDAIKQQVTNSVKKDLLKSISMIVTTVIGIAIANIFQYLD